MPENTNPDTTPPPPNRRRFLRTFFGGLAGSLGGGATTERVLTRWYTGQQAAPHPLVNTEPLPPLTVTTPSGLRVHHIQTGYVAVKSAHRSFNGPDGMGIPAIAADRTWTEWMPVSAWVIEHPQGVIVVDTGETYQALSDPHYFACDPGTQFFYRSFLRFALRPEEEIAPQLATLGIRPGDVRWVVQTHLHGDHMGGLGTFENAEVIVSGLDYPASQGTLPCRYPDGFNPTLSRFSDGALPGFEQVMQVTDGVFILPTPGHTAGHQSLLLEDEGLSYLFAGDTSFDENQLLADGTAGEPAASRATLANIRAYAETVPTVYLPSHDPDLRTRLQNHRTVPFTGSV